MNTDTPIQVNFSGYGGATSLILRLVYNAFIPEGLNLGDESYYNDGNNIRPYECHDGLVSLRKSSSVTSLLVKLVDEKVHLKTQ